MSKMKENPRYCVVSVRISDDEKEALDTVARLTRRNVSSIMREAFQILYNENCPGTSHLCNGWLENVPKR
jgi:uncharacterized protein (DUF1778 family)